MKKLFYLSVIALSMVMVSCSGKYDKMIRNWIIGMEEGDSKMSIGVTLHDACELRQITVKDSVDFVNKKQLNLENQLQYANSLLENYMQKGTDNESADNNIINVQKAIDSLKSILPTNTLYEARNSNDVLAIVVNSTYTVTNRTTQQKKAAINNFILSPDGKTCYGTLTGF